MGGGRATLHTVLRRGFTGTVRLGLVGAGHVAWWLDFHTRSTPTAAGRPPAAQGAEERRGP